MRASISIAFCVAFLVAAASRPLHSQTPTLPAGPGAQQPGQFQQRPPDFERMLQQQADTDRTWKTASEGFMQMDKITYRSKVGDMDIPAFVFQPLKPRGPHGHPALV